MCVFWVTNLRGVMYSSIPPKKNLLDYIKPIGSMYGIFTYIYHKNQLNAGKYAIHRSSGEVTLKKHHKKTLDFTIRF